MSLKNELQKFKAEFITKVDSSVVDIMAKATDDLENEFKTKDLLSVGDRVPDFTLLNAKNESVSLSEKLKEGPVVITFYRGNWCPYCNIELRAYQQILPEIKAAGGSLIAISPQTPDSSLSMTEKHNLEFEVLSDVSSKIAHEFGIAFKLPQQLIELYNELGGVLPEYNGTDDWTLPVPATFVIDTDGTVVLTHVDTNYQNRLEPTEALAAVKKAVTVQA